MRNSSCTLTLLALLLALPTTAVAAPPAGGSIPTMLVGTSQPARYPDPICSKCSIIVTTDESSNGASASIRIAAPSDAPEFRGGIEVTVLLDDDERRVLRLRNVHLSAGDELELVAESPSDWSWHQTRFVWLRFVPT